MCTAGTCGLAMWATRLIPVAKKLGSSSAPGMLPGEFRAELAAYGRDVDPDLLEHLAGDLPANAAAAGFAARVGPVPRRVGECGVRPRFALDRFERCANAVAQRLRTSRARPVADRRAEASPGLFAVAAGDASRAHFTIVIRDKSAVQRASRASWQLLQRGVRLERGKAKDFRTMKKHFRSGRARRGGNSMPAIAQDARRQQRRVRSSATRPAPRRSSAPT